MRRQHTEVVKTLVEVEDGEKRNYKIEYDSLAFEGVIGEGGFGVVHKAEYPTKKFMVFNYSIIDFYLIIEMYHGADVAVKKLKASLNKNQLEEFTREAATMVGLRHPSI